MTPQEMKKRCLLLKEMLDYFPPALENHPIYFVMKGPIDKVFNDKAKEDDIDLRALSGMFFLFFDICSLTFGIETIYLTMGHFKLYINKILNFIEVFESGKDPIKILKDQVENIDRQLKGEKPMDSEAFTKQFSKILDQMMQGEDKRDPRKDN